MLICSDPPPPPPEPVFSPGFYRPRKYRTPARLRRLAVWLAFALFILAGLRALDVAIWTAWTVR